MKCKAWTSRPELQNTFMALAFFEKDVFFPKKILKRTSFNEEEIFSIFSERMQVKSCRQTFFGQSYDKLAEQFGWSLFNEIDSVKELRSAFECSKWISRPTVHLSESRANWKLFTLSLILWVRVSDIWAFAFEHLSMAETVSVKRESRRVFHTSELRSERYAASTQREHVHEPL